MLIPPATLNIQGGGVTINNMNGVGSGANAKVIDSIYIFIVLIIIQVYGGSIRLQYWTFDNIEIIGGNIIPIAGNQIIVNTASIIGTFLIYYQGFHSSNFLLLWLT